MATLKPTPAILYILLVLAEGPSHGYAILSEVERRSGGAVSLGPSSLYYTLGRLADRGLVEDHEAIDGEEAAGPHAEQRRSVALTAAGRAWLESELSRMTDLVAAARASGLDVGG